MKVKYCNVNKGVYQLALLAWCQPLPYFFFLLSWTHRGQNHFPLGFVVRSTQAK